MTSLPDDWKFSCGCTGNCLPLPIILLQFYTQQYAAEAKKRPLAPSTVEHICTKCQLSDENGVYEAITAIRQCGDPELLTQADLVLVFSQLFRRLVSGGPEVCEWDITAIYTLWFSAALAHAPRLQLAPLARRISQEFRYASGASTFQHLATCAFDAFEKLLQTKQAGPKPLIRLEGLTLAEFKKKNPIKSASELQKLLRSIDRAVVAYLPPAQLATRDGYER
ncbi:hypothetical protein F5Y15DRAFT_428884 [Xylariaceae sp. FL0016]|nr:hypothetical protein F5Y15DRAFT_428884 [Xylariaceae sp. FL0016]